MTFFVSCPDLEIPLFMYETKTIKEAVYTDPSLANQLESLVLPDVKPLFSLPVRYIPCFETVCTSLAVRCQYFLHYSWLCLGPPLSPTAAGKRDQKRPSYGDREKPLGLGPPLSLRSRPANILCTDKKLSFPVDKTDHQPQKPRHTTHCLGILTDIPGRAVAPSLRIINTSHTPCRPCTQQG